MFPALGGLGDYMVPRHIPTKEISVSKKKSTKKTKTKTKKNK